MQKVVKQGSDEWNDWGELKKGDKKWEGEVLMGIKHSLFDSCDEEKDIKRLNM